MVEWGEAFACDANFRVASDLKRVVESERLTVEGALVAGGVWRWDEMQRAKTVGLGVFGFQACFVTGVCMRAERLGDLFQV